MHVYRGVTTHRTTPGWGGGRWGILTMHADGSTPDRALGFSVMICGEEGLGGCWLLQRGPLAEPCAEPGGLLIFWGASACL